MKKPFFAKYLEAQKTDEERDEENDKLVIKTGVKAGRTRKYPSDGDEFVTLKYPSDDDEGGIDI